MPEKKIVAGFPDKDEAICLVHNLDIIPEEKKENCERVKITEDTYLCVWGRRYRGELQLLN